MDGRRKIRRGKTEGDLLHADGLTISKKQQLFKS